jgi:hypothetical protein
MTSEERKMEISPYYAFGMEPTTPEQPVARKKAKTEYGRQRIVFLPLRWNNRRGVPNSSSLRVGSAPVPYLIQSFVGSPRQQSARTK